MGDLQGLHSQARRLIMALRAGLDRLEALELRSNGAASDALEREMHQKLLDLQKVSVELDAVWRMQNMASSNGSNQTLWKRKVEQVSDEADHLSAALQKHTQRQHRKHIEEQEREELLSRRSNINWQDPREAVGRGQAEDDERVRSSVATSKRVLDEALDTGTAILDSLSGQRDRLKAAQRKAFDVMNSVGISASLLRVIDRRHRGDRWITYGGMAVITIVLVITWWLLRRK